MTAEDHKIIERLKAALPATNTLIQLSELMRAIPNRSGDGSVDILESLAHDVLVGFKVDCILVGEIERLTEEVAGLKGRLEKMEENQAGSCCAGEGASHGGE